ncbi:uncharacterized protein LOC124606878 isoform X2 [Schistocerca americana]|uniref:uncharacterized protein LOC124606878 isoform X2 n=1 Tax=Schistocerca americana TaxID=7009 RepID=UPI001F500286|nr:uncharacterized protein LOC124606878 isoform X2 [Schistocerca americana]
MRFLFLVGSVVLVSVCLQHETCATDVHQSFRDAATQPPTTTTGEVPQFNRTGVELDVNEYVTAVIFNISKDAAMVLNITFLNTADRIQQLVAAAKPFIAAKLGLDISASSFTTTEPIESLVPRVGPQLGGESAGISATSPQDSSVNRTDRSGKPAF